MKCGNTTSCGGLYYNVSNTQSDQVREISTLQKLGEKWTISNLLPFDIEVYCSPKFGNRKIELEGASQMAFQCADSTNFVGNIKAQSTLNFECNSFSDGDELVAFISSPKNGGIMLTEPERLHANQKNIKIGGVVYRSTDGGQEYNNDYADISSVQIHNHFPFPLDLIFRGAIVAQIGGSDGMTYKGGSNAVLNFNNSWQGLNIGDKLTFRISSATSFFTGKELYTVMINDDHTGQIHVGSISSDCTYPFDDSVSYSVHAPPLTGVTYYEPVGDYTSKRTNPIAFM
ncbi:hypothetical protein OAG24_00285 [bacterium]|nr:hypothetical protein [bacterium]